MTLGLDKGCFIISLSKVLFFLLQNHSYIVGIEKLNDFYYVYMFVCLYKHTAKSFVE